jgi:hypothetical protein
MTAYDRLHAAANRVAGELTRTTARRARPDRVLPLAFLA